MEQVRRSTALREEIAHYDRVDRTHPDRSYDFVMRSIRKYIERQRHRSNRSEIVKALSGGHAPSWCAWCDRRNSRQNTAVQILPQRENAPRARRVPSAHAKGAAKPAGQNP